MQIAILNKDKSVYTASGAMEVAIAASYSPEVETVYAYAKASADSEGEVLGWANGRFNERLCESDARKYAWFRNHLLPKQQEAAA